MTYLKDEQYYIDIYDLYTIKECLRVIEFWQKLYKEKFNDKGIKDLSEEERIKGFNHYLNLELYGTQGERYRHKKGRIEEMVEEDRKKQDFYDNTSPQGNISCCSCGKLLYPDTKILEDFTDKPMRVLFYFPCPTCKKKRAIYNTGEEFVFKPALCPKCNHELKETHVVKTKGKGKVIIWTRSCPSCKYTDKEEDDFEKKHLEWEKEQQKDKELLKIYREELCLSDEKGKEYIEYVEAMEVAKVVREEEMQKYGSPIYQRSLQLKKIGIVEVEKLLIENLEKEKYIKLSLDKPQIERYVIVPFTIQDADSSRQGYESTNNLQKIITTTLDDTNWRLVNNSLSYRLGYISGQLKGYEQEEDILKLAGKEEEKKPKPKIDEEKRRKYEHNNLVQLARLFGKHDGIENIRKRRLVKEPNGFFLDESEGLYTCAICRETIPGNKIWWNLDGLRCADCWRNIQERVIPPLTWDNDSKIWLKDWEIHSDYGIHPSTARKLRRDGLLKGRDLKRKDGNIYCTVFLVEENKEFLKKYLKKPKMKVKYIDPQGKEVNL